MVAIGPHDHGGYVELTRGTTGMGTEEIARAQGSRNAEIAARYGDVPAPEGPIRNVIFDFGEVLVHWDPAGPLSARYTPEVIDRFRDNAVSGFDDANAISDSGHSLKAAAGEMDTHDPFWGAMMRFYLERFDQSLMGEIPGARQLISDLHRAGYKCWGLSNWSPENFHWVPERYPIIRELDGYLVSGFVHRIKPNQDIFDLARERFGITAGSSVFIDDKPGNVEAARSFGFGGIVQKTPWQVRGELRAMGVRVPALIGPGDLSRRPED